MRRQNIDGVTTFNAIDVDVEARSESEVNNIEENIRKLTEEIEEGAFELMINDKDVQVSSVLQIETTPTSSVVPTETSSVSETTSTSSVVPMETSSDEGLSNGAVAGIVLAVLSIVLIITIVGLIIAYLVLLRLKTKSYNLGEYELASVKKIDVSKSDMPPE